MADFTYKEYLLGHISSNTVSLIFTVFGPEVRVSQGSAVTKSVPILSRGQQSLREIIREYGVVDCPLTTEKSLEFADRVLGYYREDVDNKLLLKDFLPNFWETMRRVANRYQRAFEKILSATDSTKVSVDGVCYSLKHHTLVITAENVIAEYK